MHFENLDLSTYPYKEIIELFEKFPGEIYPWAGNFRYAPTGEPYWTIMQSGYKKEGEASPCCTSYREAFVNYKVAVLVLFERCSKDDTLYFRRFPSPVFEGVGEKEEHRIYSRFLISGKPVIQSWDGNLNVKEEQ